MSVTGTPWAWLSAPRSCRRPPAHPPSPSPASSGDPARYARCGAFRCDDGDDALHGRDRGQGDAHAWSQIPPRRSPSLTYECPGCRSGSPSHNRIPRWGCRWRSAPLLPRPYPASAPAAPPSACRLLRPWRSSDTKFSSKYLHRTDRTFGRSCLRPKESFSCSARRTPDGRPECP